jgi:putative tricarboxylic transport membrane protein
MTIPWCLLGYSSSLGILSEKRLSDPEKSSSLFLLLLAFVILCGSARLGRGSAGNPGPGFLPFWGAAVLFVTSVIEFLLRIFSKIKEPKEEREKSFLTGRGWLKVIYVILALVIYTIFFERIGFILCTFFLMIFLLTVVEARRWHIILIESLLITLISYVIFEKGLTAGFPKGALGF